MPDPKYQMVRDEFGELRGCESCDNEPVPVLDALDEEGKGVGPGYTKRWICQPCWETHAGNVLMWPQVHGPTEPVRIMVDLWHLSRRMDHPEEYQPPTVWPDLPRPEREDPDA